MAALSSAARRARASDASWLVALPDPLPPAAGAALGIR